MTWQYVPSPCATCYDALHLCLTAPTALLSIAANPPPSISLNPHPCLVLSCRPLLLRHHHLSSTPIASSPPPAATTISFPLPILPLRLHLLHRLLSPCYRLLCIASSTPQSHFASVPPLLASPPPLPFVRWPSAVCRVLVVLPIRRPRPPVASMRPPNDVPAHAANM